MFPIYFLHLLSQYLSNLFLSFHCYCYHLSPHTQNTEISSEINGILTFLLSQHTGDMTGSYQLISKVVPCCTDHHLDIYWGKGIYQILKEKEQMNKQTTSPQKFEFTPTVSCPHLILRIIVNFPD